MSALIELSGLRFGSWMVVDRAENSHAGDTYWNCKCECGVHKRVSTSNLRGGQSKSCGCSWSRNSGDRNASRKAALERNGGIAIPSRHPAYRQAYSIKNRAAKAGVEFGFSSISECAQWVIDHTPIACPVLGIRLRRGPARQFFKDSPTVDRRDPKLGYVPSNLQVISMQANAMKHDASADELLRFAFWVLREWPQ